jgi:sugar-phosphatase
MPAAQQDGPEAAAGAIDPARCVAIEDSRWGIESARAAGLRTVAVTTSYRASALAGADLVVDGVAALDLGQLDRLCATVAPRGATGR